MTFFNNFPFDGEFEEKCPNARQMKMLTPTLLLFLKQIITWDWDRQPRNDTSYRKNYWKPQGQSFQEKEKALQT